MTELRKACQHGKFESHWLGLIDDQMNCPGGTPVSPSDLLALLGAKVASGDDILIHRDTDGNWPLAIIDALNFQGFDGWAVQEIIEGVVFGGEEA